MKVDEFKDQLQILKNTNESNKKTIFKMSKSILTMKKLFDKILNSKELPSYLEEKLIYTFNKQNPSAKSWYLEWILTQAFNNKSQKEGDKNKLGDSGYTFKQYESLQSLKLTLPKQAIKTFNEFVAKHQIILPLVLPAHYNHSTYSFDWNSIFLDGPFFNGISLLIEHNQNDKPMFQIY